MQCEEISERLVELLYNEDGTPPPNPELRAHVESCTACRGRLRELETVRKTLQLWKDEAPLAPIALPESVRAVPSRPITALRLLRYAAAAAVVILALLGLSGAEVTWNQDGFAFRTLSPLRRMGTGDVYTKAEVRELLLTAMRGMERDIQEANFVMMQRMLDTVEAQRYQDLQSIEHRLTRNAGKY